MSIPVSIDPLGTLGASHEPPPGYTSLAAIHFSASKRAQMDIGLAFDLGMVWSTKMAIKYMSQEYALHGVYDESRTVQIGARPDEGLCAYMGAADASIPRDTEAHVYVVNGPGRLGSVDGFITQHGLPEGFIPSSLNLLIGGRSHNTLGTTGADGDVYWTRVSRGGVLLADCVPVLDPNGIACLWDRARNAAIYSISGTPPDPVFEP